MSTASRSILDNEARYYEKEKKASFRFDDDDDKEEEDENDEEGPDKLQLERTRTSQVIRPGAVAVRGISCVQRSTSTCSSDEEIGDRDESYSAMNGNDGHHSTESTDAVVVVPEEDVERPDEELEARRRLQDEERAEQFAAQVREAFLEHAVQAEVVTEKSSVEAKNATPTTKRRRVWLFYVAGISVVVIVVVLIIVPILIVKQAHHDQRQPLYPRSNSANNSTSSSTDTAPAPFSLCIYCLNLTANLTSDFSNETNLTIFELLQTGLNHTLLPEFLDYSGLATWSETSNITLFAPLDASFEELPLPYQFYQSNFYWIYHLTALLDYHIVIQPLNATQIFRLKQLPAVSGPNITVNETQMTVAENYAKILLADIPATNGYIQIPDRVLLPNDLRRTLITAANELFSSDPRFSIFGHLFSMSRIEETLSLQLSFPNGLTLLIPTDAAFKKLDSNFLTQLKSNMNLTRDFVAYHLVPVNAYQEVIISVVQQIDFLTLNRLTLWFTATNFNARDVAYANAIPIQYSILSNDGYVTNFVKTKLWRLQL
jgi:uncharacterized surface protein with fasciclin (FAS1) repeats